ncbi:MAG: hypothetical protein V7L05_05820 [Nostoc sp.]|uniref:hypothetical protein n=1 Tax=Nostoc sp. TaxID=1180 RepID=UPI002FF80797
MTYSIIIGWTENRPDLASIHDRACREGNDILYGGSNPTYSGNDSLYGGSGDDLLYGGAGNDRLDGYSTSGTEYDTLVGGDGSDTFVLGGSWGVSYQSPMVLIPPNPP